MRARRPSMRLLPTGHLGGIAFILGAMWYAGASQGNGAAYLLFFVLLSVLIVSVPGTLMNLARLEVYPQIPKTAFAGQESLLSLEIVNLSRRPRHAIAIRIPGFGGDPAFVNILDAGTTTGVDLRFKAPGRGEHEITNVELVTIYPCGFVKARVNVAISHHFTVYPLPLGDPNLPRATLRAKDQTENGWAEGDDFSGVRSYIPGESQRHVDWKAVARGQPMMTKQFTAENSGLLDLDFAAVPQTDVEARLSQLALWIIEAERFRRPYGLRLPSIQIPPTIGEAHYHRCLRALARFA